MHACLVRLVHAMVLNGVDLIDEVDPTLWRKIWLLTLLCLFGSSILNKKRMTKVSI